MSDLEEVHGWGTSPVDPGDDDIATADSDGDGLLDVLEGWYGGDPLNPDTDGGDVSDGDEATVGTYLTDPRDDGIDPWSDTDGNGLTDPWEAIYGTDPSRVDTDGGGLSDGEEVHGWGTSPLDPSDDDVAVDSDGDGLPDVWEAWLGADPANPDTDGGGVSDGEEVWYGTSPVHPSDDGVDPWADTDADGLSDIHEVWYGTNPNDGDTDGGGLLDGEEVNTWYSDPNDAADDALITQDTDRDGLSDRYEPWYGTDPNNPDTDGGGIGDGWEAWMQNDPTRAADDVDADGDLLSDQSEQWFGTDPYNADSDGGGVNDGLESITGYNPFEPGDDAGFVERDSSPDHAPDRGRAVVH